MVSVSHILTNFFIKSYKYIHVYYLRILWLCGCQYHFGQNSLGVFKGSVMLERERTRVPAWGLSVSYFLGDHFIKWLKF